jgi:hypothetical protein
MIEFLIVTGLAMIVFGVSALLLIALLLRAPKEAQRTLEVVLNRNRRDQLITHRKRVLNGLLSMVRDVRIRLRLTPSENSVEKLAAA